MEQEKILNKFNSLSELTKAYVSLESEFTKRCNALKNLQQENESLKKNIIKSTENFKTEQEETNNQKSTYSPTILKEESLENVKQVTNFKIFGGGESVITPPKKPKSLQEANLMAKQFLKGDN